MSGVFSNSGFVTGNGYLNANLNNTAAGKVRLGAGNALQITGTTTNAGLTVACQLDANAYEKGIKIPDAEMAALNLKPASFHGEWNYTIAPRKPDG